jgi:hypothetical protein
MLSMAVAKYHGLAKRGGRGRRRGVEGESGARRQEREGEELSRFCRFYRVRINIGKYVK